MQNRSKNVKQGIQISNISVDILENKTVDWRQLIDRIGTERATNRFEFIRIKTIYRYN